MRKKHLLDVDGRPACDKALRFDDPYDDKPKAEWAARTLAAVTCSHCERAYTFRVIESESLDTLREVAR